MKTSARAMVVALSSLAMAFAVSNTSHTLKAQTPMSTTVATASSLVGTWTLTAADDLLPDSTRVHAYGSNPQGLLVLETDGRYTLQIFRDDRVKFASGDKRHGTPDEYKDASVGMSCHFGHYTVDSAKGTITFKIERASFANWDGATQTRPFTLKGDDLEWHVPATPDGKIPISAWHRVR
jgi:Lipocalin-like domain